ncbi:hypothetical protein BO99DRAFT_407890 [Aspergillus violaceofuscus CBS 115571]|uniref:Uncharacterized protein n=1 Tax=Aspergillus violaceofuscus (strain CBS 115571) TaxID=1450538 RepID=A0A2V5GPI4_ASPV1|nr:hypothetical protein BO99DRAFT_407890 [Aspergillus violaceofuscus CBS 115571]
MDSFRPSTVKALVEYLYVGGYGSLATDDYATVVSETYCDAESSLSTSPDPATLLLDHIRVHSIGDYYQIDGLVTATNDKIRHLLQNSENDKSWVASLPAFNLPFVLQQMRGCWISWLRQLLKNYLLSSSWRSSGPLNSCSDFQSD